jgi:hypothetical protein
MPKRMDGDADLTKKIIQVPHKVSRSAASREIDQLVQSNRNDKRPYIFM